MAVEACYTTNCPGRVDTAAPGRFDSETRRCDGPGECEYSWEDSGWVLATRAGAKNC